LGAQNPRLQIGRIVIGRPEFFRSFIAIDRAPFNPVYDPFSAPE
jgi:hypothetical protein